MASHLFSSTVPLQLPLIEGINQLVNAINTDNPLHVDLVHCGLEPECLNEQDRNAIYFIVKTQLKIIVEKTKATVATVHLAKNYNQVAIVIEDNGKDVDLTKLKNSRSLKAVQKLVGYHKGQFVISCEEDSGMVLKVLIHVQEH